LSPEGGFFIPTIKAMKKKRNVLIMGLGLHGGGAGAANFFTAQGDEVTVTDLKSEHELRQGLELLRDRNRIRFVLGRHDYGDFEHADLVIQNPGVPPDSPYIARARERGIQVETDISIFLELVSDRAPVIVGVTGTKGKSTTASLIHAILSLQGHTLLAGNITVSVFDILEEVRHNSNIVLELSSFQLGGLKHKNFSPPVAVMTNLLDDHLNYYASREAYFEDKRVIHRFQHDGDILVLNRENQVYDMTEENRGVNRVSFGMGGDFTGDGSYLNRGSMQYRDAGSAIPVMSTDHIQIKGRHNIYNALAAAAAAMAMGVKPETVKAGIETFPGLPHRLEPVPSHGGLRFINDSAATTPDAAAEGIFSIDGSLTLIAGGADKGLDLHELTEAINRRVGLLVLLEGNGTRRLLSEKIDIPYAVFNALPEAVEYACKHSVPPATILLSPGFASFGMFRNEFDRGDQFRELIKSGYGNSI
jgi:UDP-N-acetylmuramoylalanine--D-glutamate ligase